MKYIFSKINNNECTVGIIIKGNYEKIYKKIKKLFIIKGWNYVGGFKQEGTDDLWFFPIWVYSKGKIYK